MSNRTTRSTGPAVLLAMSLKVGLASASLLALGTSPLLAGDRTKIGGAVSLNLPLGDLKTDTHDKPGLGAAFQVTFDLGAGHAIRPRADLKGYQVQVSRRAGTDAWASTELVGLGVGVDYLHYFAGRTDRGLYAVAGLNLQHWEVAFTSYDADLSSHTAQSTHRKTTLGGALGLGYQVTTWFGVEARYTHARYEGAQGLSLADSTPGSPATGRTAAALELAATFRW